jgi:hypothetical protein
MNLKLNFHLNKKVMVTKDVPHSSLLIVCIREEDIFILEICNKTN